MFNAEEGRNEEKEWWKTEETANNKKVDHESKHINNYIKYK